MVFDEFSHANKNVHFYLNQNPRRAEKKVFSTFNTRSVAKKLKNWNGTLYRHLKIFEKKTKMGILNSAQ